MNDDDDKNVLLLPVKMKEPVDESRFLVPVPIQTCGHFQGPFEVDPHAGRCKCKRCGGEVSAMFVLEQMMNLESRWMRTRAAYQDEMKRLHDRSHTKCRHCGKLTRISSR